MPAALLANRLRSKYDATAPAHDTPEWSANPVDAGNYTTLTVPVNDPTSGVAEGEYFMGSDPGEGNGTAMDLDSGGHTCAGQRRQLEPQVTTTELIVQDVTPPVVDYILSAQPNVNGWYNSDVTIDWKATDPAHSSGTPTDPPDTVAAAEGESVLTLVIQAVIRQGIVLQVRSNSL